MQEYFENALKDIVEISNEKAKSQLEPWYEVLKKVMRLWSGGTVFKSKQAEEKTSQSDVDGFYVFLYDEEDKNN